MTNTTTAVDISPLIQVALSFLAVVLPALGAYIAYVLKQKMNIQANSAAAQAVDTATSDGAGLAYKLLAQEAKNVPHSIDMQNAAIATGAQYVLTAAGDSVKVREETGDSLGKMIAAKLGTLMASDPNISIGPVADKPAAPVATTTVSTTEATPSGGKVVTTTVAPTLVPLSPNAPATPGAAPAAGAP